MNAKLLAGTFIAVTLMVSLSLTSISFAESPLPTLTISDSEISINEEEKSSTFSFTANVDSDEINISSITLPTFLCEVPVITPEDQQTSSMMPCIVEINQWVTELDGEGISIAKIFDWNKNNSPPNGHIPAILDNMNSCNLIQTVRPIWMEQGTK